MTMAQETPLFVDNKTVLLNPNRIKLYDQIKFTDEGPLKAIHFPIRIFPENENHHHGLAVSYYLSHQGQRPKAKVKKNPSSEVPHAIL